jgi:hypothetical protein
MGSHRPKAHSFNETSSKKNQRIRGEKEKVK